MENELERSEIIIINARLVLSDSELRQAALSLKDGMITGIYPAKQAAAQVEAVLNRGGQVVDFTGDTVIPGLIDLHVHGCGGADTMDTEATSLDRMAACLLQKGTTAFLATTMTSTNTLIQKVFEVGQKISHEQGKAELLGFHLEGPCISDHYRGAQKIDPGSVVVNPISNLVKIITLAPELPEAEPYIEWAKSTGNIASVGHSGASFEQMQVNIERGIRQVTHAFNAMPGIHHRNPGLLTAVLLDERVTIELIADGVHIHPAILEMAIRLKTADKIVLVSDGTRAVGLPDGEYELGGQTVCLSQGRITLPDGTIAGSALPLMDGVRLISRMTARTLYEVVRMATLNPARLLKVDDRLGSIDVNKEATFLRLSDNLELRQVWQRGQICRFAGGKIN